MIDIIITNKALKYLNDNLLKESEFNTDLNIYISVIYPFTKYAHVNITFCTKNDIKCEDFLIKKSNLSIYLDKDSISLLKNAVIDIKNNALVINAPNIFLEKENETYDLKNKIKNLFENEINVILSQHGGFIELVDFIKNDTLVIKFHGGCQGCGMVGYTLTNYIEKMIKNNFPQIKNINDITSHEIKENAYY